MAFSAAGNTGSLSKTQFDSLCGSIASNMDAVMNQVQALQTFFAANADANFTAASGGPGPTGYTSGDIAILKSAFSDLDQLRTIYQGSATLGSVKDFRAFIKQIWGTGVH